MQHKSRKRSTNQGQVLQIHPIMIIIGFDWTGVSSGFIVEAFRPANVYVKRSCYMVSSLDHALTFNDARIHTCPKQYANSSVNP